MSTVGPVSVDKPRHAAQKGNFRRRIWYPAVRAIGLEGLRFHDLRHTNATLAAESGASLRSLRSRLGHASAAAAIRYQHKVEGQDAKVADYLDEVGRSALQDRKEAG